jgi:cytoplasmic iron level regulating protein YaaA (DUF328/UPF0246 family)
MSSVVAVNDIKKHRMELLEQLEELTKHRAERSVHISRDLNRKIHKLETALHQMTMKHREEIKKCYSGAKKTSK